MTKLWNKCKNDEQRWSLLIKNKNNLPHDFMLWLDSDSTYFDIGENSYYFDGYIGWTDCTLALLDAIGIPAEQV